jgi:hypothetical protein
MPRMQSGLRLIVYEFALTVSCDKNEWSEDGLSVFGRNVLQILYYCTVIIIFVNDKPDL